MPWAYGKCIVNAISDIIGFHFEFIVSMLFAIEFKLISGSIGPFELIHLAIAQWAVHENIIKFLILWMHLSKLSKSNSIWELTEKTFSQPTPFVFGIETVVRIPQRSL